MKHIAIVQLRDHYSDYQHDLIAQSITEWSEVSNDDFELLKRWSGDLNFSIIERLDTDADRLIRTVEQARKLAQKAEDEHKRQLEANRLAQEKRAQKKLERQQKKGLLNAIKQQLIILDPSQSYDNLSFEQLVELIAKNKYKLAVE